MRIEKFIMLNHFIRNDFELKVESNNDPKNINIDMIQSKYHCTIIS